MERWVEIEFDCIPLRSVGRLDIPIDASPKFQERCRAIKTAIETHGTARTYFLHNARCVFHLTNNPDVGRLEYRFEGTIFTDDEDQSTSRSELKLTPGDEKCDWLNDEIREWFRVTATRAIEVEFNRYISVGDLRKRVQKLEDLKDQSDDLSGFIGMYL